ncbi:MAG: phage tail protein [Delftia acidovorans]|nr:MAG: phage tail protein [Delftia acidovorans]
MPAVYTTKQGQTVDLACKDYYGRTAEVTESVMAANPGIAAYGAILPMGTKIVMPDIAKKKTAPTLPSLWD